MPQKIPPRVPAKYQHQQTRSFHPTTTKLTKPPSNEIAKMVDPLFPVPIDYQPNKSQSKDSSYTYIHFNRPRHADLFEDFCKDKLPDDEIYVPPHNQPINPEDEDDVVPDQHAAFGIQRATQKVKEAAWKDLGLGDLMKKGPGMENGRSKAGSRSLPR
jgi:hypothetical protein